MHTAHSAPAHIGQLNLIVATVAIRCWWLLVDVAAATAITVIGFCCARAFLNYDL